MAHAEQTPPFGPMYPLLHVQLIDALQPLHDSPEFTGHAVQVLPFGPYNPALQVQAVSAVLRLGEVELAGHARQVVETVAANVLEYVAASQWVQATLPVAFL